MNKFRIGDEVVVKICTTPGSGDFQRWSKEMIATQSPLTVQSNYGDEKHTYFKEVQWVLYPSDLELVTIVLENE